MRNQLTIIGKIMGIFISSFSFTYLIPVLISLIYRDHQARYFLITFAITLILGLSLYLPFRNAKTRLKTRDGFIIVTLFWTVLSIISALPLHLSSALQVPLTHAIFEATSGFTTTGATVLVGLDHLPKSILWYRTQLHFFGGMGIIILAVAIMPLLGMGGMALFKAEASGMVKEDKITPRIAQTARSLWAVYLILLILCALTYLIGGMDLFDAVTHAFTTIATAGFSNYDASLGHFNSKFIESSAILFMFLGSINFTVHILAFRKQNIRYYLNNTELRTFFTICVSAIGIIGITLYHHGVFHSFWEALHQAAFAVMAMITTTGLSISAFSEWPTFIPLLIIFLSFIGGCAGSTAGGIKVIRIILLTKQALREIKLLIHPHAKLPIKINNRLIPHNVLGSVWAFLGLYAFSTGVLTLIVTGFGLSPLDAFSAVAACLNITGPGLGEVASNYQSLSNGTLSTLIFTMLLGRLEIFTIFVLLMPSFWRN